MAVNDSKSNWTRELDIFSKIKSLIILEGDIFDLYHSYSGDSIVDLQQYLHFYFKEQGYKSIVFYDSVRGFYNHCEPYEKYLQVFAELVGLRSDGKSDAIDSPFTKNDAVQSIQHSLLQNRMPSVVIMNFASRYIADPQHLEQRSVDCYNLLHQAALNASQARSDGGDVLRNILIIITNKTNDLPSWFFHDNPCLKIINILPPSRDERRVYIENNIDGFFTAEIWEAERELFSQNELDKLLDRFTALTEGFSFRELGSLRAMCRSEETSIRDLCDVVDLYKFGIKDNPWRDFDKSKLKSALPDFRRRVKGQDQAIIKTLDIVKRAVTGMAGIRASSHGKPKGVLFFAGPTGTGKTETAKTLAEKIFGDENSCIRFDMSEYGQPHSDQRLLGAPPGYVGYEVGGQLTNAVKKNPFSILLFDEIEKAHVTILDKFLQILEDGRMTDGQGNTVYFSEAIIIFTSNLGISEINENGERRELVNQSDNYEAVQKKVRQGIVNFFHRIGRPEILNRLGENIVVFDFIRPETAREILDAQLANICSAIRQDMNITLNISRTVRGRLLERSLENLANGGRGIGNIVESYLIDPLSRYMFDENKDHDCEITVESYETETDSEGNITEKVPSSLVCR